MVNEVTEQEFSQAQLANRHKEIKSLLSKLSEVISSKDNQDIILALQRLLGEQSSEIAKFVQAVKAIPAPQVNVQSNDKSDKIIMSIQTMAGLIIKGQQELKGILRQVLEVQNRKKEWNFIIIKNSIGSIESVKAIQTK